MNCISRLSVLPTNVNIYRYLDTFKVFNIRPDHLYNNIDVKRSGEPLTRQDVCGVDDVNCDPLLRPENVKGRQRMKMLLYLFVYILCHLF